jgi:hypothetical protein
VKNIVMTTSYGVVCAAADALVHTGPIGGGVEGTVVPFAAKLRQMSTFVPDPRVARGSSGAG